MTGPEPTEHHLAVTRTARYWMLGRPGPGTRELWIACHGYRQSACRFVNRFAPVAAATRVVVAPEGLSRFYVDPAPGRHGPEHRVGASWMTREDREREIADYVRYLDALAALMAASLSPAGVRVVALGFSQGGHTAARWVALGRTRVDELVLWASDLPVDLDPVLLGRRLSGAPLTLVLGERDPAVDAERRRRQEEMLRASGVSYRLITHDGGHEIDGNTLVRLGGGA